MNNKAFINILDSYIPEDEILFEAHSHFFDTQKNEVFTSSEAFYKFSNEVLQLSSVRHEKQLSLEEMLMRILDKNVEAGHIDPDAIDYIIVANDFNHQLKNFGHYVQAEFEMQNAQTFHLTDNYCVNIDLAINLAAQLVRNASEEKQVLILTGLKLHDNLEGRIVGNYGVLGDAAGLMVVSNVKDKASYEVVAQSVVTQGSLYDMDYSRDNTILHFQSYSKALQQLFREAKIPTEEISKIVLHNANHLLIEQVLSANGVAAALIDKENQNLYGHLGATDLILNLKTLQKAKSMHNVVSLNLGFVGTYAATLYRSLN